MYIYGLLSSENNIIRYVGQTKNTLDKRLNEHIYIALKYNGKTHKDNWIRKVYSDGFIVNIICLEEVNEKNINEREIYWITQFDNLTNTAEGGVGGKVFKYNISYEDAKNYLKDNFKFKSKNDFCKNINLLPIFIPKNPYEHYKSKNEWISWGDFLSTNNVYDNDVSYLTYNESKKILKFFKLKTKKEFLNKNKELKLNGINIPNKPERYYKKRGWNGYADFLSLNKKYVISYDLFIRYIKIFFKEIKSYNTYKKYMTKIHYCFPKQLVLLKKMFKNLNWDDLNYE